MGLDVSLYRIDDVEKHKANRALEAKYSKESEKIWDKVSGGMKYEFMTDEIKEKARKQTKALAKTMGLDEWGSVDDDARESVEEDSTKYPDHINKIGYFRSSYNSSGMNHIFSDTIGMDLYDIFEQGDDYEFCPEWEESLKIAKSMLKKFNKYTKELGNYSITCVTPNMFSPDSGPSTNKEALDAFMKVKNSHKQSDDFNWFTNSVGEFFLGKSPTLVAAITGKDTLLSTSRPATYLIYELADGEDSFKHYREALEIVIETIEYVLATNEPEKYYLSWSS